MKKFYQILAENDPSALPTGAPSADNSLPPDTSKSQKSADTYGALQLAIEFLLFPKTKELDSLITPEEKQTLFDMHQRGISSDEDRTKALDILNKLNLNI